MAKLTLQDLQAAVDGVWENSMLENSDWDEEMARLYKMKVDLKAGKLSQEDELWFNQQFN
jgi:hypothetical protein